MSCWRVAGSWGLMLAHFSIKISNFNFAKAGAPPVPSRTAVRPGPSLGKIKICKTNERTNGERTNERRTTNEPTNEKG